MATLLGTTAVSTGYDFGDELQLVALANASGVALCGRSAEIDALRSVGRREASLGRVYEGHVNASQLVARYGSAEQHERLDRDIRAGHVGAVWNTQDGDRLRIEAIDGRFRLSGSKTWASGAGSVTRALVTAAWPDESLQMCLVPMDRVNAAIDLSEWHPLGMDASNSGRVTFNGVALTRDDLIGGPRDYERQPWFFGGALRFLAVHTGIVERLVSETTDYLERMSRDGDVMQQTRVAQMRIAYHTCRYWLTAGVAAWEAFDRDESEAHADAVIDVVDMARVVIERAALDVIELAVRSVGARGLVEPLPFARLVRDLQMYLRQPAPDAVVARVGKTAFRESKASRASSMARSTETGG